MKNRNCSGVLSVEAAISLTMLVFMIIFILDIGFVYRSQNVVYHGLLQAAKTTSLVSYEANTESAVETSIKNFLSFIGWEDSSERIQFRKAILKEDATNMALISFKNSVAARSSDAKDVMLDYNVKKIKFDKSKLVSLGDGGKDFVIQADYTVNLLLPVFGIESVDISQSATSRMWKAN